MITAPWYAAAAVAVLIVCVGFFFGAVYVVSVGHYPDDSEYIDRIEAENTRLVEANNDLTGQLDVTTAALAEVQRMITATQDQAPQSSAEFVAEVDRALAIVNDPSPRLRAI